MKALTGFYAKYPPSTPMMVGTTEEVRVDEAHTEIFVAENYLGVLVFDLDTLQFKRGWGAYGHALADISTDPADHQWLGRASSTPATRAARPWRASMSGPVAGPL